MTIGRRLGIWTMVLLLVSCVVGCQKTALNGARPGGGDQRVLAAVNGEELRGWQAQAMIAHGAATDNVSAVERWTDIKIKAQEARRRGLDQDQANAYIMELFADGYLANRILVMNMEKELGPLSDDILQAEYDKNLSRFQRPMTVNLQHITLKDEAAAQQVADLAREAGADFAGLVAEHSSAADKNRKGMLYRAAQSQIQQQLGPDVAAAINADLEENTVIGPLQGKEGFEVVKVLAVTPGQTTTFEQVKPVLERQLKQERVRTAQEELVKQLQNQAQITKSDEIIALEKMQEVRQQQQRQQQQQK